MSLQGQGLFITGTDTEVGKTMVTCALLWRLRKLGRRVAGFKPVAAGEEMMGGESRNPDAEAMRAILAPDYSYREIAPYSFEPPIAPHLAAAEAGVAIDLQRIVHAYQNLSARAELTLVEGAGGWRVPINEHQYLSDVPRVLQLPVVLVVGVRLGCLNHALLTAEAIRHDGLRLVGWVANVLEEAGTEPRQIEELRARLDAPLLVTVPFQASPHFEQAAAHLDLRTLTRALSLAVA